MDADIVAIRPEFPELERSGEHLGKPELSKSGAQRAHELIRHWKSQIQTVLESGKTVIIFVAPQAELAFTETRRGVTNRLWLTNYDLVPVRFDKVVVGQGREMKLANNADVVARYWQALSPVSLYHVYFDMAGSQPLVATKNGEKMVGAIVRGKGNVVCIPDLDWNQFLGTRKGEKPEDLAKRLEEFSFRLRDGLLSIDAALRPNVEEVPEPEWAAEASYKLEIEAALDAKISRITEQVDALLGEREKMKSSTKQYAALRLLLFGTGKPLEAAVRDALRLLGFEAQSYVDADSEFDIVFTSEEGRFLGEAEGRDNKAIDVTKFSQLQRNLGEDLSKAETKEIAKGVLFGNAQRLLPPGQRDAFFTLKVLNAAKQTNCALVRTPDLFSVARFLTDHPDDEFASKCRRAIAAAGGVVEFPPIPGSPEGASDTPAQG